MAKQLNFDFERPRRRSLASPTKDRFPSSVGDILQEMGFIVYETSSSIQEECEEDFSFECEQDA